MDQAVQARLSQSYILPKNISLSSGVSKLSDLRLDGVVHYDHLGAFAFAGFYQYSEYLLPVCIAASSTLATYNTGFSRE